MSMPNQSRKYLVTGASGYVGGRLVRALVDESSDVRILVRDKYKILGQPWATQVDICEGSAENISDLERALAEVHTAFYLLHSINLGPNFDEIERQMAQNFAQAAERAGVSQIIYLGGIANDVNISKHLASRAMTGK
uniref:NAD(P)H-binding protein n=1 Tax=Candidatus Planktophila sp. TaxID=2175601 RepID=UPI00404A212F